MSEDCEKDVVATYQVQTPACFNFAKQEYWTKWICRSEHFRKASGLGSKEGSVQVNTLLYSIGSDANDILRSFRQTDEQADNYDVVKSTFDAHFVKKKKNVIYERTNIFKEMTKLWISSLCTFTSWLNIVSIKAA